MNLFNSYYEKFHEKSTTVILRDIFIRLFSLACFPVLYSLLFTLNIFYPIRVGFLYRERIGHLVTNTDIYLRKKYLGHFDTTVDIFFTYNPTNHQVCKLFSRVIPLIQSEFLTKIFAPFAIFNTKFVRHIPTLSNEYPEKMSAPSQVAFTPDEEKFGYLQLESMGVSRGDWFVCIHARDNAFTKDLPSGINYLSFGDYRNADINTYNLAAEEVVKRGGFVIRVGSVVDKSFDFHHPKVIDYSLKFRTDFMDIFLSAKCRFFIGTANGATDIASLFDTPTLMVNTVPIGYSPTSRNSMFIPKRVLDMNSNNVPFRDQLMFFQKLPLNAKTDPTKFFKKNGWTLVNNSPNEIRDATLDMFNYLENGSPVDSTSRSMLNTYFSLFDSENIYRQSKSPCAPSFLKTLNLN